MEIEKIEYKENETIMTIKTTGLICFEPFLNTMLNDNDNKWYMPTAVINREVYGFLDMKADYVFEKMDSVKEYSLKVMEPNRIEIIEEEIINLRSYTTVSYTHLKAHFIDLDVYNTKFTKDQILMHLEAEHFGRTIPRPNLIIDSGRGFYLIWLINTCLLYTSRCV